MECPQIAVPFLAVWTILIAILGIVGNVLTIATFWKHAKLSLLTNIFIVNLACSDLLFCTLSAPLLAAEMLNEKQDFHPWVCNIHGFIFYGSLGSSMLGLACITLTRYLLVAHNKIMKSAYVKYILIVVLLIIWLLPYSLFTPVMFSSWGKFEYEESICICIVVDYEGNNPQMPTTIFGFALPCTVHIVCYSLIFWIVQRAKRNIVRHINHKQPVGLKKDNLRITKIIFVIVCLTFMCYIPFMIVKATLVKQLKIIYNNHYLFVAVMAWTHCCLNPIIYASLVPQYRQHYLKFILHIFRRFRSKQNAIEISKSLSTEDEKDSFSSGIQLDDIIKK